MNNANLQKAGFIVLPYGTTLNRFLEDRFLEILWDEEVANQKLKSEILMSDEKHLPEIVPIYITIPLSKIQINEPEPILRRLNVRLAQPEGFFEIQQRAEEIVAAVQPQPIINNLNEEDN